MKPRPGTFTTLVQGHEDLRGLVAYALYKADKIEFSKAHPGADIEGFVLSANLPSQIESYLSRADVMLDHLARQAFGAALNAAEEDYATRIARLERALGFWRGVLSAVIANLIAAAISILLVVLVFGHKLSFWSSISDYLST